MTSPQIDPWAALLIARWTAERLEREYWRRSAVVGRRVGTWPTQAYLAALARLDAAIEQACE